MIQAISGQSPNSRKPVTYSNFVADAREFVESRGVRWGTCISDRGEPADDATWDLRTLTGSHARHACRLNAFHVLEAARAAAVEHGRHPAGLPAVGQLDAEVQDFIKAVAAFQCQEKWSEKSARDFSRNLQKLFSTTTRLPWELSSEDLANFIDVEGGNKRTAKFMSSLAKIINEHALSRSCPLIVEQRNAFVPDLRNSLYERSEAEKLPDTRALLELVRIVFQETPVGHQDRIRFAVLRIIILTGLRVMEVLMLPLNCLRREEHVDVVTGKPASEVGGVSKSLGLRYFAEKQSENAPDLLVEDVQQIPERFASAVIEAVELAQPATSELRRELRNQHEQPEAYPGSDLRCFTTSEGERLTTADLLFLVIFGGRGELQDPLPGGSKIAPVSLSALYQALGMSGRSVSTIFSRYGKSAEVGSMVVRPHSLRHLMNTEYFRLNLPDTIITQQFGRQAVAQSYQYDHRSLAERLSFVELPEAARGIVEPGSPEELVARMVLSGQVPESAIARSFRTIQSQEGDEMAFRYLVANADGFHVTPYGFCTNSFAMNPCARHLKCFDRCKHYAPSGLPEHRITLERLSGQLRAMRDAATRRPSKALGRKNQISHAEVLLAGVQAALSAPAGLPLFPEGVDHSRAPKDLFS